MSSLTFLVAESFLMIAGALSIVFIAKLAADKSAQILTGIVLGTPVSPAIREGMLFGMWLPWQAATVAVAAFLALAQLEMANHVTNANVKVLVYLGAFLAALFGRHHSDAQRRRSVRPPSQSAPRRTAPSRSRLTNDTLAPLIRNQVPSTHRAGFDAVAGCVGFNRRRIGETACRIQRRSR